MPVSEQKIKRLRIIAGPNGSGKTTFFYFLKKDFNTGVWINADEILALINQKGFLEFSYLGFSPDIKSFIKYTHLKKPALFIKQMNITEEVSKLQFGKHTLSYSQKNLSNESAAFLAEYFRYWLLENDYTFTTETVMSHPSKMDLVKKASKKNYRTYLYFMATENPEINISRVKARIKKGGHSVSKEKLIQRFQRSIDLVKQNIFLFTRVYLLDNSHTVIKPIASFYHGKLEKIYDTDIPQWVQNILPK